MEGYEGYDRRECLLTSANNQTTAVDHTDKGLQLLNCVCSLHVRLYSPVTIVKRCLSLRGKKTPKNISTPRVTVSQGESSRLKVTGHDDSVRSTQELRVM